MAIILTDEQENYIRDNFDKMSVEKLRNQFNEKYGTEFKVTAFHYHTNRLGLKKHIEHQYTEEEDEFLRVNSPLMSRAELTRQFNERFGTSIKLSAITTRCCQRDFHSSNDGKFKKGSVPWEKCGRDKYVASLKGGNSGSFKKGNIPPNLRPLGSTRKCKYSGHLEEEYIKTESGWKTKRTVAYEQVYGELPEGLKVLAVDGNKDNIDIDNLRAIDNYTLTVLMSNEWHNKGPEIFDAGVKYAGLMKVLKQNSIEPIEIS